MNLYDSDLKFDPDKAAAELRSIATMNNDAVALRQLDTISAAALVDIADSLRTLAVESAVAMSRSGVFDTTGGAVGLAASHEAAAAAREAAGVPDSLAILSAETGQKVRHTKTGVEGKLTGEAGIDQGEAWAEFTVDAEHSAAPLAIVRAWASELEAIEEAPHDLAGAEGFGDEPTEYVIAADGDELVPAAIVELADGTVLGDGVEIATLPVASDPDDLDDDFDGDRHTAAKDAAAALKARRKAAKKGKKG